METGRCRGWLQANATPVIVCIEMEGLLSVEVGPQSLTERSWEFDAGKAACGSDHAFHPPARRFCLGGGREGQE